MNKHYWKKKIVKKMKELGTYKVQFTIAIDTLAQIMELRDDAVEKFQASGGHTVIRHTNKGGSTNIVENPALSVILKQNAQALSYMKELGITSASYRKVSGQAVGGAEEIDPFGELLADIAGGI